MSLLYDDEETDRLLAAADDIDFVGRVSLVPRRSYWALQRLPRLKLLRALQEWHPVKGATGNCVGERAFARGPSLVISDGRFSRHIPSNRQGGGGGGGTTTRLKKPCYFCRCGIGSGTFSRASSHRKPSLTSTCVRQEF